MRKDCDTCLHDEFGETYCNDCYWANGKPPTKWEPAPFWTPDTNADRIRGMSDEELAEWMARTQIGAIKDAMNLLRLPYDEPDGLVEVGKTEALEWLKQPAEVE
jgi:hypothetical protein